MCCSFHCIMLFPINIIWGINVLNILIAFQRIDHAHRTFWFMILILKFTGLLEDTIRFELRISDCKKHLMHSSHHTTPISNQCWQVKCAASDLCLLFLFSKIAVRQKLFIASLSQISVISSSWLYPPCLPLQSQM